MAASRDSKPDVIVNREPRAKPIDADHMGRVYRLSTTNPDMADFYFSVVTLKAPLASLFDDAAWQAAGRPALRAPLPADDAITQFPALTSPRRAAAVT